MTEDEYREAWDSIGVFEVIGEHYGYHFRRVKPKKTEWRFILSKYYYPKTLIENWFNEMIERYGDD